MKITIKCECGNEETVEGFGEVYDGFDLKEFSITADQCEGVTIQCRKCYKDTVVY